MIFNLLINILILSLIIFLIIKVNNLENKCQNGNISNKVTISDKKLITNEQKVLISDKKLPTNEPKVQKKKLSEYKKLDNDKIKSKKESSKFVYDQKKCFECIKRNNELGQFRNCSHCGSENYDTGCIPAIVQKGKPNNCIPKELTPEQAYWACKSVSDSSKQCSYINKKHMLEYQKEECKREDGDYDYYCGYDESDSCSYNKCNIDDYYSYGSQSICDCQKVPHEILPNGIGRECIKGKNCVEYKPNRKAPELLTDPGLKRFYDGYATYMDVPRLNTWYSALLSDVQII